MSSGINWYEATVGGGTDKSMPETKQQPSGNSSGISWYNSTVGGQTESSAKPVMTAEQGGLAEDIESRNTSMVQAGLDVVSGDITPAEGILRAAGDTAGAAFDVMGAGVSAAADAIIPDVVKDKAIEGFNALAQTEIGRAGLAAIGQGMDSWSKFKEASPRAAENIEATVNVGLMLSPTKIKANAKPTVPLQKKASSLSVKGKRQTIEERQSFLQGLIREDATASERQKLVGRTKVVNPGKLTEKQQIIPSIEERGIARVVSRVGKNGGPKVLPGNSFQLNHNIIDGEVSKLAKKLEKDISDLVVTTDKSLTRKALLSGNKVKPKEVASRSGAIQRDTYLTDLRSSIDEAIAVNPTLRTERSLGNLANEYARQAERFITSNENTPRGLLRARKDWDNWMNRIRPSTFSEKLDAHNVLNRAVRHSMNKSIHDMVPSAKVQQSLTNQSMLMRARDALVPKAEKEAKTKIGQLWDNVTKTLPGRNKLIQEAALIMGTTALGAATIVAPYLAGGVGAILLAKKGTKWAGSAKTKEMLSRILKASDEAIKAAKDPTMIHQLRIDRAAVLEILDNFEEVDEYEGITIPITEALGEE